MASRQAICDHARENVVQHVRPGLDCVPCEAEMWVRTMEGAVLLRDVLGDKWVSLAGDAWWKLSLDKSTSWRRL